MKTKKRSRPRLPKSRRTIYSGAVFFTDGKSGPPSASFYEKHPASTARIRVGAEEQIGDKVLRCFLDGRNIAVQLFGKDGSPQSPKLVYKNASRAERSGEADLLESWFDTQHEYTINSPWHHGEQNVATYTVASLRKGGQPASHDVIK